MNQKIIIGTRGSQLALAQTEIIQKQLQPFLPNTKIDIKTITTTGDKNMNPVPLDSVGKGWFTKELDKALLNGTIDVAVHSLKDLPEELPDGLTIGAIPAREDAREAFISNKDIPFGKLKKGAVIGTDSLRRKVQLLYKRPDLEVKSIRGNVLTRLDKLQKGEYDGIFLAVAGLKRISLENKITEYFAETDFIPSPGQGALAVVIKKNNITLFRVLQKLNHQPTMHTIKAERSFSTIFGGGCKMPVGAYATCNNKKITIYGAVGSPDGKHLIKDSLTGDFSSPMKLGKQLAQRMLKKSYPWYVRENEKYIVITRPENENKTFIKQLRKIGLQGFSFPTIVISKNKLTSVDQQYLHSLNTFDWIVFTSKNGVRYFIETLNDLHIDTAIINQTKIAAVGEKTAEELKKNNLNVQFVPTQFTTNDLAKELKVIKGKKILLPRANIATPLLTKHLEKKGATVVNIPVYKTQTTISYNKKLETLFEDKKIACITFTSPSTVKGFLENIGTSLKERVVTIPVVSIGPVTTKTLQKNGFQKIYTAETFTEEGILTKLQEIIL